MGPVALIWYRERLHAKEAAMFLRRHIVVHLAVALCSLALPPPAAQAREDLGFSGKGDSKPKPYLAPDGSFAAVVPNFWQPREFREANVVEFRMPGAGMAWLQVRRDVVAPNTQPRQLLLRARESRLSKLPHFRENGRRDIAIGGHPGAAVIGDYWYQGNAEYPRAVEELFVIVGNEAFEMHFECFAPMADAIHADVMAFYMSFIAHPAARPAPPPASAQPGSDAFFNNLPF